jgi:hypothetical protein
LTFGFTRSTISFVEPIGPPTQESLVIILCPADASRVGIASSGSRWQRPLLLALRAALRLPLRRRRLH